MQYLLRLIEPLECFPHVHISCVYSLCILDDMKSSPRSFEISLCLGVKNMYLARQQAMNKLSTQKSYHNLHMHIIQFQNTVRNEKPKSVTHKRISTSSLN